MVQNVVFLTADVSIEQTTSHVTQLLALVSDKQLEVHNFYSRNAQSLEAEEITIF